MKKLVFLVVSVIIFVTLSIIAFNFSNNSSKQLVKNDTGITKSIQTTNNKINTTPTQKPVSQTGDYVIENIKTENTEEGLVISWKDVQTENMQNLRLIRTASNPEGKSTVYNVLNSNGRYIDKDVDAGIRYYYELQGKSGKREVYSGQVSYQVEGNINLPYNQPFFTINNKQKYYEPNKTVNTFIQNGHLMIPLKSVVEVLGGSVYWVTEKNNVKSKNVVIKYKKTEVEMFNGKQEIIVNRKPMSINFIPIVKNDTFYASATIIKDFFGCQLTSDNTSMTIIKPLEQELPQKTDNSNLQIITVIEGDPFEITLMDQVSDGKKWFYSVPNSNALSLLGKRYEDEAKGSSKYILTFKATKSADINLSFRYFNPGLGENTSDNLISYQIKPISRQ